MTKYIDLAIKLLCYIGYIAGLLMFVTPIISPMIRNRLYMRRIRNDYNPRGNKSQTQLLNHLRLVLYVIYDTKDVSALIIFISFTIVLFVVTLAFLSLNSGFSIITVLISAAAGMLPYFYLRVKLRSIRIEGSYEAEGLITELINQYKINYFNMIEAIDKTLGYLSNYPYSKRAIVKLAMAVKDYSTNEELEKYINEFVFSINTEWSTMLGMNIYLAIVDGTNVTESLEDILRDLKSLKAVIEKDKRENNESFVMIKYLSFLLLAFTILCAVFMFNISIDKIIEFQFKTPMGIRFSAIIVITIIINFGMLYMFKKPKYDL